MDKNIDHSLEITASKSKKGFSRIRQLAVVGTIGMVGAMAAASKAKAATTLSATDADGFAFEFTGVATTTGDSANVSEGTISTSSSGPGSSSSRDDAFDGTLYLDVDGTTFTHPSSATVTSTSVTSDVRTMSGLDVVVDYSILPSRAAIRAIYTFTNNTGSVISADANVSGDYGSDDDTILEVTGPSTTFYITSEDGHEDSGWDPILTLTRYGVGASVVPTDIDIPEAGNDEYELNYGITVEPGETVRIIVFQEMSLTIAGATGDAADFATLDTLDAAGLLYGLSPAEIDTIVNYAQPPAAPLPPAAPPEPVPILSGTALISLAASLGLFGLAGIKRGRKKRK